MSQGSDPFLQSVVFRGCTMEGRKCGANETYGTNDSDPHPYKSQNEYLV